MQGRSFLSRPGGATIIFLQNPCPSSEDTSDFTGNSGGTDAVQVRNIDNCGEQERKAGSILSMYHRVQVAVAANRVDPE